MWVDQLAEDLEICERIFSKKNEEVFLGVVIPSIKVEVLSLAEVMVLTQLIGGNNCGIEHLFKKNGEPPASTTEQ